MIQKIIYGDSTIRYNLIKSRRIKTSQIIITADGVTVRVPQGKTIGDVKKVMQEKAKWVFKKQLEFAAQKRPVFSIKLTLPVYGKDYKICIIPNSPEKTVLVGNTIQFHIPQKRHSTTQIKKQYQMYLQKKAKSLFPKLVHELADKVGVSFAKINIKQYKGRWGSATVTGEINLNYNLTKAPRDVIKYVIFHELCHLKIAEHSYQFWNLIAKHMPEYEESKKWLKDNGVRIN